MVYRQLFCDAKAISTYFDTDARGLGLSLSAQFLRTCTQIHSEGLSILYGENTFHVEFHNLFGPHNWEYHEDRSNHIYILRDLLLCGDGDDSPSLEKKRWNVLPHLRRLEIRVVYMDVHPLFIIRSPVRRFFKALLEQERQGQMLKLDVLRMSCDFDYNTRRVWTMCCRNCRLGRHAAGTHRDDNDPVGVLRTWIGQLRNVKEVIIKGMPEEDADILRKRCQTRTDEIRTNETMTTKTTPLLPDLYDTLEKHLGTNETYKLDLKDALLVVEKDDEATFRAKAAFILEGLKKEKKKKEIVDEEGLWQFAWVEK